MQCRRCKWKYSGIQKIWATSSLKHVCIHKLDLHLAQQGISNQSRARQVQFRRNKSITHDLALTSRNWKAVLLKLIQVSQTNQNKLPTFIFQSNLSQANFNARGWKLVKLHLETRPNLCQKTIRSLKHSFQSCTALPGFSQVQSEPFRKLDQCDKQSHLDLFNPFQEQFKQFYQI